MKSKLGDKTESERFQTEPLQKQTDECSVQQQKGSKRGLRGSLWWRETQSGSAPTIVCSVISFNKMDERVHGKNTGELLDQCCVVDNTNTQTRIWTNAQSHAQKRTHSREYAHRHAHTDMRTATFFCGWRFLTRTERTHEPICTSIYVVQVRAMPTLSVIPTSSEVLVPEIFVEAGSSLQELAHAATDRLAVAPVTVRSAVASWRPHGTHAKSF